MDERTSRATKVLQDTLRQMQAGSGAMPEITHKSAEEVVEYLAGGHADPGSPVYEAHLAVLQLRLAERSEQASSGPKRWAMISAIAAAVSAACAVVAIL
jgi:hypothetical protein